MNHPPHMDGHSRNPEHEARLLGQTYRNFNSPQSSPQMHPQMHQMMLWQQMQIQQMMVAQTYMRQQQMYLQMRQQMFQQHYPQQYMQYAQGLSLPQQYQQYMGQMANWSAQHYWNEQRNASPQPWSRPAPLQGNQWPETSAALNASTYNFPTMPAAPLNGFQPAPRQNRPGQRPIRATGPDWIMGGPGGTVLRRGNGQVESLPRRSAANPPQAPSATPPSAPATAPSATPSAPAPLTEAQLRALGRYAYVEQGFFMGLDNDIIYRSVSSLPGISRQASDILSGCSLIIGLSPENVLGQMRILDTRANNAPVVMSAVIAEFLQSQAGQHVTPESLSRIVEQLVRRLNTYVTTPASVSRAPSAPATRQPTTPPSAPSAGPSSTPANIDLVRARNALITSMQRDTVLRRYQMDTRPDMPGTIIFREGDDSVFMEFSRTPAGTLQVQNIYGRARHAVANAERDGGIANVRTLVVRHMEIERKNGTSRRT